VCNLSSFMALAQLIFGAHLLLLPMWRDLLDLVVGRTEWEQRSSVCHFYNGEFPGSCVRAGDLCVTKAWSQSLMWTSYHNEWAKSHATL
jgi:hypothetical protein